MGPDTGVEPVLNEYESFVLPIYESGTRASYVNRTHIPGVQNPCTSHCTKKAYKMYFILALSTRKCKLVKNRTLLQQIRAMNFRDTDSWRNQGL